jgi:hypothetical protein
VTSATSISTSCTSKAKLISNLWTILYILCCFGDVVPE